MKPLPLFSAHGVEIEYMIVDCDTLDVRPLADKVLWHGEGPVDELDRGPTSWSNELALHVVEIKTNGPSATLEPLPAAFAQAVTDVNERLQPHGAMLMPTAMHPWMEPLRETVLWPHDNDVVYRAFDRIFDCRGHGWSNLQSTHLNLPFANDDELTALHRAIRLWLPLMPALTASSPAVEGRLTGALDSRLLAYRDNCRRVPQISGGVVPEEIFGRSDYDTRILQPIYRALEPHDPDAVLRHEWANARGAIVRFDRMAVEIRVLDCQEHPGADLGILAAITAVLRQHVATDRTRGTAPPQAGLQPALQDLLWRTAREGRAASVSDPDLLAALRAGIPAEPSADASSEPPTVGDMWRAALATAWPAGDPARTSWGETLDLILDRGNLAERIRAALGQNPDRPDFHKVYRALCSCLARGEMYVPN